MDVCPGKQDNPLMIDHAALSGTRSILSAGIVLLAGLIGSPAVGAASFGTENPVDSSQSYSGSVFCTDVDSDDDIDLVVVKGINNGRVNWFENNGSGTAWTRHEPSTPIKDGKGVYAADLEQDGDVDLLAIARFNGELWILENDGSQNFTASSRTISPNGFGVLAVDMDGDGDFDLVVSGDDLEWFEQTGTNSGSFAATSTVLDSGAGRVVFAADLERDGDADLLNSDASAKEGRIYINNGSGIFTRQTVTSGADATPDGIAAGDMDNDGDLDVVVAWSEGLDGFQIEWFEQSGLNSGTFINTPNTIDASVDGPRGIYVDDIDGDGVADVAAYVADGGTAAPDERSLLWWANNGTGTSFTQNSIQTTLGNVTNETGSACLADFNGDGLQDVAALPDNENRLSWWAGTATAGAAVANSTALALGWMEECARTWDGSSYILIAPKSGAVCSANTTALGIWEGFWVLASQQLELVFPPRPGLATGNTTESLTGIPANQYDLIGVPLTPTDGDAGAVVGDDLGGAGQHEANWRVAKYNVTTEAYEFYTGAGTLADFSAGRGFWLIHDGSVADPSTIDVSGSELEQVVGSPPFDGARIVDLSKPNAGTAKHMTANPFDYTVTWGKVKFRNPQNPAAGVTARLEALPGVSDGPGFATLSTETPPDLVLASFHPRPRESLWRAADRAGRLEKPSTRRWLLDIQVRAAHGPAADLYNRLGVVPGSSDRRDRHDAVDLPPFGTGWVRLYFPHDDPSLRQEYWRGDPLRLTNDIRRPRRGRLAWIFVVESDLPDSEWILTWPTLHQLPSGLRLTMTDLSTGVRFSPADRPAHWFRLRESKHLFRLEVDSSAMSERYGHLSGVATDEAGHPIRASVRVTSSSGYRHNLVTDGRGRYHLPDLDPGTYILEFRTMDGDTRTETVLVESGRSTRLRVRLRSRAHRRTSPGTGTE